MPAPANVDQPKRGARNQDGLAERPHQASPQAGPRPAEPLPSDLQDGIQKCLAEPDNEEAWDNLEEIAATHQLPEAIANAYVKA
ncbi:MAG TPA: hypothetical protein VK459_21675, partial [Polyangiaceae bacterium]|nr:hypothetical protein [Polyangiaceae bacterium]